jgi:ketosteroid isomerase-like protein
MSQENVERMRAGIEALNRRDLDAFLSLVDDDVVAVARAAAMEGGQYHGHDGIRRWWKEQLDVFPDFTVEVREVRDLGDVTVAVLHNRAHGAGSDTPAEETIWSAARWRRGKVVWSRNFSTQAEAFEAAGLSE